MKSEGLEPTRPLNEKEQIQEKANNFTTNETAAEPISKEKSLIVSMPLIELPIVAFFLAIAAGAMDGYAYFTTKTFATFQSGNIILSGYSIAADEMYKLLPAIISIASFALGSMVLAFMRDTIKSKNKLWTFTALSFEIIVLLVLVANSFHQLISDYHLAYILAFVAGFQGNAFHYINKMLYGNIAVTLNVQLAASYFAESIMKINSDKKKQLLKNCFDYFFILIGFAFGAFMAAIAAKHIGTYALIIPIFCLIGIFITGRVFLKKNPTANIDAN